MECRHHKKCLDLLYELDFRAQGVNLGYLAALHVQHMAKHPACLHEIELCSLLSNIFADTDV